LVRPHTARLHRVGGWGQNSSALADEGRYSNNRGQKGSMAKAKFKDVIRHESRAKFKKTSIGRKPKLSSMNKSKKRSFKKYIGQGKI
jgi:hypothetical protein